jgi:dTMP kinase
LFAADRAQHFEEVVCPAISQGKLVISDRLADSSLAYQGYGRGIDRLLIDQTNQWAMQSIKPDLIFYLKIDPKIAYQRVIARNEKLTSFESEKLEFWYKVAHGFETIFANRKDVITLDATLSPYELTTIAIDTITALWKNNK